MARASDTAVVAILSAIAAVLFVGSMDHQLPDSATTAYTAAPPLRREVQVPLAETATAALFASAGYVFHHLPHGGGGGGGNRRFTNLVTFTLCASAGVLQYVLFVQPPEGVVINIDVRAIGLAASRALPAAAAVAFFLGMALVFAQVRGGGGGGGGAVAGDGPVHGPVCILSNVALGAAAAVVGLMAVALYTAY